MRSMMAVFCLALVFGCAAPDSGSSTDRARAIEREVWSPYCPGRLLIDCTTDQARELRNEIETRARAGESTDEILDWIRDNHGEEALARPEARGAGLIIWLVPPAIFLVGAAVVIVSIRRWTTRADRAPSTRT